MEKFEASEKFLELFEEHPMDFSVKRDSGRDHSCIVIKHNYRAIEIVLDVVDNDGFPSTLGNGNIIRYVTKTTASRLYELAEKRLEQDAIQRQIDADNKAVNVLFEFYNKQ